MEIHLTKEQRIQAIEKIFSISNGKSAQKQKKERSEDLCEKRKGRI